MPARPRWKWSSFCSGEPSSMKVDRNHVSSSGAGMKVGASRFSGSSIAAGGSGRFNRDGSGNSLTTSAMRHQRGCGPIRFGTEDQEKSLIEPHNAPGKGRAISEQSRPRDLGACFAGIPRPRQACARPMLSNERRRETSRSEPSLAPQPTASVTAAWRSCECPGIKKTRGGCAAGSRVDLSNVEFRKD